jgi:acyl carrier protein
MVEPRDIEAELLGFLRREIFAPETAVTSETDLVAAGFDSMSLVRLLLFVEAKYGLWIPETKITGEALANTRALAGTVFGLLREKPSGASGATK